ncbi:hypothetical protein Ava_B0311 (plasmid) [Trichormus variabilis ATCC 29413]|uniref:ATP-binding protein n=3 Tax=Anabaena variabilis TaxID=264691 RepID=Q3M1W5_TRIV2|nr:MULTISPECIES: hypothetical protein [Nostocaceae]ABA25021.1 hypothetical protein Ava_B0311 [Trichormus variabilis ATCC 29413]MBC1217848.1 hypothetical protein [Trichormus variabilis ARAD]MBC1270692.1 hypothetical protein [Trichormus variabilis FSR]MBC1305508.1 hypothetical protein [Trichormus variabilis N2B]MBC1314652.1 hypothetical protein [Trichormus variabilis PNB]
MNKALSDYFSLKRRYSRSINLERDFDKIESLQGYILTERSVDATKRILAGLTGKSENRAWTITSVYGTGKSAFAHFFVSLCAPLNSQSHQVALEIVIKTFGSDSSEYSAIQNTLPTQGLFRAVVTAQREPLSNTIVRALERGAETFWSRQQINKIKVARKLVDLGAQVADGKIIDSKEIPSLIREVANSASTGIVLVIDELGKNLEFAVQNQGAEDLYLLQQLAELPKDKDYQIYIIGLLHQAFADYSERLASIQRNEWSKIQGRFEDIPFKDSPTQMMRLIGKAIDQSKAINHQGIIAEQTKKWIENLPDEIKDDYTHEILADTYPLHPITALVMPMLCTRYAQNDRSLFTFLTSDEPYSFKSFLKETPIDNISLPVLKLDRVYDYFIEAVGSGLGSRPNLQRWIEIKNLIDDAKGKDIDSLRVLKTIGILNLVTTTGAMRATRTLVTMAMCDNILDKNKNHWEGVIENLLQKGIITYRRQLDELRIWQGSDFNVDIELTNYLERERSPLVNLISDIRPLKPIVAQRHSYQTGTLRYFERCYVDGLKDLTKLYCSSNDCDGLIAYWVDEVEPTHIPASTADGKPLIVLNPSRLDILRIRAREFAALKKIQTTAAELQSDGVARQEVRYRLTQAEKLLDETITQTFDVATNNICWFRGKKEKVNYITDFNAKLSDICDEIYHLGLKLRNELINRRELTSQGAKARRELIEAMLEKQDRERLCLEGFGPEVAMYYSVLSETGIHRQENGDWGLYSPYDKSGISTIWHAINDFCLQAKDKIQNLDKLYKILEAPPYGVKRGVIPVLIAAVLLYHVEDVGVYKDGTFIPVLGSEHFELLLKEPSRFGVKYFEVMGLRSQVFRELELILRQQNITKARGVRNSTLLVVVKPLFQFVKKLPSYTIKTKRLSNEALAVLQNLQKAQEPDELLFTSLPLACGLNPIVAGEEDDGTVAKTLRKKLVASLHEIQTAYDRLLSECQSLLYAAFSVRSGEEKLREDLRVRASYLSGQVLERRVRSFVQAAVDENATDTEWLEALLMIVADKPAESWTDEDATNFELKLSDLARRFKNLEALQKDSQTRTSEGFEARKITVTRPDGQETHSLVWFDNENQLQIDSVFEEILAILKKYDNPQLHQAVVAKLTERVLSVSFNDNNSQVRAKRKEREHEQKTS